MQIGRDFSRKDILSFTQFDPISIELVFKKTDVIKNAILKSKAYNMPLRGNVIALLFFEPSTRTQNSFSSAVQRLGGGVIGIQDTNLSSMAKGESFEDSIRIISGYSDGIIIRHPQEGSADKAAELTTLPVVNAGDGGNEHPTQTLLDLYTIREKCKRLHNLTVVMGSDPLHSRSIRSFALGLSMYKNNTIYFVSPSHLRIDPQFKKKLVNAGVTVHEIEKMNDIPKNADIWYWNRLQRERFKNLNEYKKSLGTYAITMKVLKERGNKDLFILDPLPRVEEILTEVDADPRALYFHQARNGLYVRMALLDLIFSKKK